MAQEATMICVDNSEWMRNGDFSPSRFESQLDAVTILCGAKTRQNAENSVGFLTTAGRAVEVQVALTQDMGKMIAALHKIKIGGQSDILAGIQVAQLALRNRQNKRQEARIVLFVGSPITTSVADLKKIGGALKKNKVAVDIINFGEDSAEQNEEKLKALHEAVNSHDNCNYVTIPPGTAMLADALHQTKIIRPGGAGPASGAAGGAGAAGEPDFGIDPNMDPELAIALRLSMETAEQERRHRGSGEGENKDSAAGAAGTNASQTPEITREMEEEDPEMVEALRLSMMTANPDPTPAAPAPSSEPMEEMDDEINKAMELSKETAEQDRAKEKGKDEKSKPEVTEESMDTSQLSSEDFSNLLQGLDLPGVDRAALQELLKQGEEEKKKQEEEKKNS